MIRIRAERREDGLEISAVGHADFDTRGRDIVCAGVSALIFGFLHYLKTCLKTRLKTRLPSAAADEAEVPSTEGSDGSGGRHEPAGEVLSPTVEDRIEEGAVWVRTHGMNGTDEAAWAVTRVGLWLIARQYPDHVSLSDAL